MVTAPFVGKHRGVHPLKPLSRKPKLALYRKRPSVGTHRSPQCAIRPARGAEMICSPVYHGLFMRLYVKTMRAYNESDMPF